MERGGIDVCQKITIVAEYECTYKKRDDDDDDVDEGFLLRLILIHNTPEYYCYIWER